MEKKKSWEKGTALAVFRSPLKFVTLKEAQNKKCPSFLTAEDVGESWKDLEELKESKKLCWEVVGEGGEL